MLDATFWLANVFLEQKIAKEMYEMDAQIKIVLENCLSGDINRAECCSTAAAPPINSSMNSSFCWFRQCYVSSELRSGSL